MTAIDLDHGSWKAAMEDLHKGAGETKVLAVWPFSLVENFKALCCEVLGDANQHLFDIGSIIKTFDALSIQLIPL